MFQWGIFWVYMGIMAEQFVKFGIGLYRLRSREWINDVTQSVSYTHLDVYKRQLQKNAMTADFSWEKSAKAYEEIYGWVTGK